MSPSLRQPLRTLAQALSDYDNATRALASRKPTSGEQERYAALDPLYRATLAQQIKRDFKL